MKLDTPIPQTSIIKGDANSLSIAAASIVAKVTRDKMMADYDKEFSGYGFAKNAGYGTTEHLEGLNKLGITPIHRKTFEPIKSMVAGETSLDSLFLVIFSGYRSVCSCLFLGAAVDFYLTVCFEHPRLGFSMDYLNRHSRIQ